MAPSWHRRSPRTSRLQIRRFANRPKSLLRDLRPSEIVGHSYRTYCWARILARRDRVKHDPEVLYVAALLHDLGLAAPNGGKARCFTLVGAEKAVQLASQAGWSESSQLAVGQAITLHMNASVAANEGPEAHLLTAGAQLDVTGSRYWELSSIAREVGLESVSAQFLQTSAGALFSRRGAQQPKFTRCRIRPADRRPPPPPIAFRPVGPP